MACCIYQLAIENNFKMGGKHLHLCMWAPKQQSSGGKVFMTGIDRTGGLKEFRSTLYQGARSYICRLHEKPRTAKQAWLINLVQRAGIEWICITLTNKTMRTASAILRYENKYGKNLTIAEVIKTVQSKRIISSKLTISAINLSLYIVMPTSKKIR